MSARKNILLIGVDDGIAFWRYRKTFGAELKTPNLDRICASSMLFRSAYCQIPICGPSRSSCMSGLSPFETGVFDNYTNVFDVMRPEQFWQFRLRQDGYFCTTAGKIHHGYKPLAPHVHDVLYSHAARKVHFGPKKDAPAVNFGGRMGGAGTTDPKTDRQYYDFRSSQDALRFLNSYDDPAPFYREVGFHHPHPPFRTPAQFKEMYDLDEFVPPNDWADGFDLSEFTERYMIPNMDPEEDRDDWRKSIRNYFSAYSHVDHLIGRVWDALQASAHAKNTVVVFFSDHGYHMGDKNRFRKFTLWEEAARVPLIVHDPGATPGVCDDPVALLDIGPTILDYAGCRPMRHAVGRSLRPTVEGTPQKPRAVPTFWYGSASIRTGPHRITLYQDGSSEFHNVDEDKWLTHNLAHKSPHYAAARAELFETCRAYGVTLVEPGTDPPAANNYFSVLEGAETPPSLPGDGVVSIGSMAPGWDSPGWRSQFATLRESGTLRMAPGVSGLHYAADTNGGVSEFNVIGNQGDNAIVFKGGHTRFALQIETGPGNNLVRTSHDKLVVQAGSGNNQIFGGVADDVIHGGPGRDTLDGGWGNDFLYGGTGDAMISGGRGDDTLVSGDGENWLQGGPGRNLIVLDGGINTVDATEGHNTLEILRTGLPQTVEGFSEGSIDLSDWAVLGRARITTLDGDAVISCGTEHVLFKGATTAALRAAIRGIDLAD